MSPHLNSRTGLASLSALALISPHAEPEERRGGVVRATTDAEPLFWGPDCAHTLLVQGQVSGQSEKHTK